MVLVSPFARMGLLPLWETGRSVWAMIACSASIENTLIMIIEKLNACMVK